MSLKAFDLQTAPITYEVSTMKTFAIIAAAAGALLLQSAAFAGYDFHATTYVGSTYAEGALRDARNSSNNVEYIGCYIYNNLAAGGDYFGCSASDAHGNTYYCYASNVSQLEAALNDASWVYFYGDSSHHCQGVETTNFSYNL
jgi:hypothetical protein